MVTDEVRRTEEEKRQAQAVSQAQQGRWTAWEDTEPRRLKWSDIWSIEATRLSFMLNAVYDQLPTPANLVRWKATSDEKCIDCSCKGTLKHILSACSGSLGRYTWRHNQVLERLERICVELVDFQSGEERAEVRMGVPSRAGVTPSGDWQVITDLGRQMTVPQCLAMTRLRPDMIIFSETVKEAIMMELTVPWEENIAWAHERKLNRYENLRAECIEKGWKCEVYAVEVGCRGFLGRSATSFLEYIGINKKRLRSASKSISEVAEAASAWIWEQYCIRRRQETNA